MENLLNLMLQVTQFGMQGKYEQAISVANQIKLIEPDSELGYFAASAIYAEMKDWESCEKECEIALEKNPKHGGSLNHLGVARCKLGRIKEGYICLLHAANLGCSGAVENANYWRSKVYGF